jgi:hypothetical protein
VPPQEWVVFIDESGDFDREDGPVCACGVLVQEGDLHQLRQDLLEQLESVYPGIRYPPHTTELNIPLAHLELWMHSRRELRDSHLAAAQLARIADALLSCQDAEAAELVGALRAWKPAGHDALRRCDTWLRTHAREDWELLRGERDAAQERMRTLLVSLGEVYGQRRCRLVMSAEPGSQPVGEDRYLRLVTNLLERVRSLLHIQGESHHHVRILAAERWRAGTHRMIKQRDIQAAVTRALSRPGPGTPGSVEMEALAPQPYDENVHPGLALADFASNRIWTALRSPQFWRDVHLRALTRDRLRAGPGAPAHVPARTLSLSAAASAGLAREVMAAAAFAGTYLPSLEE